MKTFIISLIALILQTSVIYCQNNKNEIPVFKGSYLGQTPPGDTPVLFAPDIMNAEHGYHNCIVFSPDLTEAFWRTMDDKDGGLFYSKLEGGSWTISVNIDFGINIFDPAFSPDGKKLYFLSFQSDKQGEAERERIWYIERTTSGWSEPSLIDEVIRAHPTHWTFSFAKNGNLYFTSQIKGVKGEQDIYISRFEGGKYLPPEDVGDSINSEGKDLTPFISYDESYLIFARIGKETKKSDLYISYKKADNTWTKAIEMGPGINSTTHDLAPYVSPDGKYLFFISQRGGGSRMYWMDAKIIEGLKLIELK